MTISPKAESLLIAFEGWDRPWLWPGGSSGISIPIGYDIGYEPFERDWRGLLPNEDFVKLKQVQGLKGQAAATVAPHLRGIIIPHGAALRVFNGITVPRYIAQTLEVFPRSDLLPPDAFGALVDLVFNRGTSIEGPRRIEMYRIRSICLSKLPDQTGDAQKAIHDQILLMRRLWANTPSDSDIYDRRTKEAELVLSA